MSVIYEWSTQDLETPKLQFILTLVTVEDITRSRVLTGGVQETEHL